MSDIQSYETYPVLKEATPEAVVIYCSDPRFQAAFREFIEGKLGLVQGTYIPFVIDGGAGVLGRPEALPKEFKFMKERLELFKERFSSIRRIILVNHEDCTYYDLLSNKLSSLIPFHLHLPHEDMKLIHQVFTRLLSHLGMNLELYYAKFIDERHTQIKIDPV
jgi:hypothetical protein